MSGELPKQTDIETILRPKQVVGGKYRVERLMAQGGMAAVWAGVNERTGKRVALKVILRSFAANREATDLLRREALAASRVNHPNVVSIFDVIDHEGMTCIVMELLEGETLAEYLARKGPLGLDEAAALLLPAMRGVAAANAMGVVHRDLKPGNIFLCSDREGRLLATKVLDFGISTMVKRTGDTSTSTDVMPMFGTPAYMSPEAIECSTAIDGRADVYGFGILFFESLTGRLPFPGEPSTELLTRIITEPAPSVAHYRPDLPAEVTRIIACALAKKVDDRFPDMEQFVRTVEEHMLPALPMSRKLSPVAGTSLFLLSRASAGSAAPRPGRAPARLPSGRVPTTDTVGLYSGASQARRTGKHAPGIHARAAWVAREVERIHRTLSRVFSVARQIVRRRPALAAGVATATVLLLTVGVVLIASSGRQTSAHAALPSASVPGSLPPPPTTHPAPGAAGVRAPTVTVAGKQDLPAAKVDPAGSGKPAARPAEMLAGTAVAEGQPHDRGEDRAERRAAGHSESGPSDRRELRRAARHRSRARSDRLHLPRAGKISVSDF